MSTASAYLTVRGIDVDVVYKDIKNLHIGVYPPLGRVRVAAPERLDDDQVRLAVIQRLPWIKRQREQLQAAERQTEREMVTGESHYVWGDAPPTQGRRATRPSPRRGRRRAAPALRRRRTRQREQRRELLDRWYREQLRARDPGADREVGADARRAGAASGASDA